MASSSIVQAKIASLGMSLLQPAAGVAALERLLAAPALTAAPTLALTAPAPQVAVDVVPFRWRRMLQRYQPLPPLFQAVAEEVASSSSTSSAQGRPPQQQQARPAAPAAAAARPAATAERLLLAVRAAVQDVLGREVGGFG
jgi:hypothetical protein